MPNANDDGLPHFRIKPVNLDDKRLTSAPEPGKVSSMIPDNLPDLKSILAEQAHDCFEPHFSASSRFALFDDFRDREEGLLLAVSGGADSLALLTLCYRWHLDNGCKTPLFVASVDHGLRPEARAEAEYVGKIAKQLGILHDILLWEGEKPTSNLQSLARVERYALLKAHAEKLGVRTILTAHHADDQAETFVMRLLRGSSVRGLSAMRKVRRLGDIELARPLLSVPKAELEELLTNLQLGWCEDPSNQKQKYQRVKVRQEVLPLLQKVGLNRERLVQTSKGLARAEEALQATTQMWFDRVMRAEPGRALSFGLSDYLALADEFRLRLLQEAMFHVAGEGYPCEEAGLINLDETLSLFDEQIYQEKSEHFTRWLAVRDPQSNDVSLPRQRKSTLSDCCFEIVKDRVWIFREIGRAPIRHELSAGEHFDWQGIFEFHLPIDATPCTDAEASIVLRPLGEEGRIMLKQIGMMGPDVPFGSDGRSLSDFPIALIEALPSLWRGSEVIFVMDLPEIAKATRCPLEFMEKNTRFT